MRTSSLLSLVLVMACTSSCDWLTQRTVDLDIALHEPAPLVAMRVQVGDTLIFADVKMAHDVREYWDIGSGISSIRPDRYDVYLYRNGTLLCGPFDDPSFLIFQEKHCFLDEPVPPSLDTYELVVEMEDYGVIGAVQQMPRCVPLDTLIIHSLEASLSPRHRFAGVLEIRFTDPAGEANFYEIVVKDSCNKLYEANISAQSLDHKALQGAIDRLIFSDIDRDGQQVSLLIGFDHSGIERQYCSLRLEFISITEDRYRFLKTLPLSYEAYNNPFAEPVFIHYNIENGIGIFSAECPYRYWLYY